MGRSTPPEELWDVERFAALLGKTPRFIYRLTSGNRVRYIQLGRDLRFDPADISDYLER
jgi:excisionase family DNA binding protein